MRKCYVEMRLNLNEVKYDQNEFIMIEFYTTLKCSRTLLFELIINFQDQTEQIFSCRVC